MDMSRHICLSARRRSIRAIALGFALVAVGAGAPAVTLADDATFIPITQNERSIMLIESKEAPTVADTGDGAVFQPMTASERSIMLIESKEAPGGVLAGGMPAFDQTSNGRSIALIEGRDPANFPTGPVAADEEAD